MLGRAGAAGARALAGARARASGSWVQAQAGGRALDARQAGAGRAGRARLALGSAFGALGPFSIRFDSFFFLSHQMNTVDCKIKFFRKKKYLLNSNKIK